MKAVEEEVPAYIGRSQAREPDKPPLTALRSAPEASSAALQFASAI